MIEILFFIVFQAPELELPKVTIYGERTSTEVVKESLLPDSASPLPAIGEYKPKTVKLRARDVVRIKNYTTRLRAEVGSSERIRIYTGLNRYSLSALYGKDVTGLKEVVGLNLGLPHIRAHYLNLSFKGGGELLGRRYSAACLKFSFVRTSISFDGGFVRSVLSRDEHNLITFDATYNANHLDVGNKTKVYINEDFISSVSVRFPLCMSNFTLSPGIFAALSNSENLSRVYPILSVMSVLSKFSLSLSYSPYTTILDGNELLVVNSFSCEAHHGLNTGSLIELTLDSEYGRIRAGYRENYPVFYYDTTLYSIGDTGVYFIGARTEWNGYTLDVEYRHNVTDYMPYLSISPEVILKWGGLDCSLSSPIVFRRDPAGSYTVPTVSLLYTVFRTLSLVFDVRIPLGETELWKGCDKESNRIYLGVALNL
ncbi:hypothetical protein CH333_10690 [candidate division WOR-3 bacterium JGI_Cruoil_03_44_89]|uniref:Uncharacterized protein n=1 Tax=candidate division WOR-3 bacterium JGI_Cruoil_03_44_89 TaxID=1973748 RepID=A0A235BME8_UNCW3|nr:MAG: hypothetical protein CH333_10690 [candidate division WOR-3 bacterium JGI_Cruoil_03_44_89]